MLLALLYMPSFGCSTCEALCMNIILTTTLGHLVVIIIIVSIIIIIINTFLLWLTGTHI